MKKILLAFDGSSFSEGAFAFVRQLNELQPVLVVGVFVPQARFSNLWSYSAAAGGPSFIPLLEQEDTDAVQESINRFETLCQENGMRYHVHKDLFDFALPELRRETRFADLMVVGSEKFYQQIGSESAYNYLHDMLHASECPVVVVPEAFVFPRKNVLAYDGSASSVYAIKQFAYLFPQLTANETLLVFLKEDADKEFPAGEQIAELVNEHFSMLELFKLNVNPGKYFSQWVNENKEVFLVSGSFGRSLLSQLFRKSFVADVIAAHKLPVFVAHR